MASKPDKLVAEYLKRLNAEIRDLPRSRRQELVEEISGHIAEARADLESEDETTIRALLDRRGSPRRSPPKLASATPPVRSGGPWTSPP